MTESQSRLDSVSIKAENRRALDSGGGFPCGTLRLSDSYSLSAVPTLELDPAPHVIHARFDPDASVIPMPTDVLRDSAAGRLICRTTRDKERAKLNASEAEFYDYLETLDGWSSLMSATVEFTGAIDPTSIERRHRAGLALGRGARARRPTSASRCRPTARSSRSIRRAPAGSAATATSRSSAAAARVVVGLAGEKVECDAAFYFLRQHAGARHAGSRARVPRRRSRRARCERDAARGHPRGSHRRVRLLRARSDIPRDEVAALWAFTVTTQHRARDGSTVAAHPAADRSDDRSGHRPHRCARSRRGTRAVEAEAKGRLSEFDGFALSGSQLFEFTGADERGDARRESTSSSTRLGGAPELEPATVELLADKQHLVVTPKSGRLPEKTTLRDRARQCHPRRAGRRRCSCRSATSCGAARRCSSTAASQIHAIDDHDAHKVETSRARARRRARRARSRQSSPPGRSRR